MPEKIRSSCFIASPLKVEPSLIDVIAALGKDSKQFISSNYLRSYGLQNLPSKEATSLLKEDLDFQSILDRIADFFDSVTVLNETRKQIWLPAWEIHRPQIEGCVAKLEKSSTTTTDYSLSIKVLGLGGGVSRSRSVGYGDAFEANGKCLQIRYPIKVLVQQCKNRKGIRFVRTNVEDIGDIPTAIELTGKSDHCGLDASKIEETGWVACSFSVPAKTKQIRSLTINSSQAAELSLTFKVFDVELGPKAVVKLEKELECSYELVGAHKYIAYFPKNAIAYYWSIYD